MLAIAGALLLAGCVDQVPSAPDLTPEDAASTAAARDPEMDPSDSYLAADLTVEQYATVSLNEPLYDPATSSMRSTLVYNPPAEMQSIEAGYDTYDRIRVNVVRPVDTRDSELHVVNPVAKIRAVGHEYTLYDASGAVIPVDFPDGSVTKSPLAMLGPLDGADITAGVVMDYDGTEPGGPRPLADGNSAELVDASTLRITMSMFEEAAAQAASDDGGNVTRLYRRQGNKWVLNELTIQAGASTADARITTRRTLRLSNVRWRQNPSEQARRALSGRRHVGVARQSGHAGRIPRTGVFMEEPVCPMTVGSTCQEPTDPEPQEPTPTSPGANVVFQHGIASSGATWRRMDPWMSEEFSFATKLVPSLPSFGSLAGQADLLTKNIQQSGQGNFVLIGHSQGGLISRRVAQWRPDLARGVLTIGTPHRGAALANNGRAALASYLTSQYNALYHGCRSIYDDAGCYVAGFLNNIVYYYVLDFAFDTAAPATGDLQPGSPFIQSLNSAPENFTRVGIQSFAKRRWVLARLGGDLVCNPEDRLCGGGAWASYAAWAEDGFWLCAGVAAIVGYWDVSYWCGNIALRMSSIDKGWNDLSAPNGDRTDGIVQGSSQVYPNATKQYPINNGESHVGETRSLKVKPRLSDALAVHFAVPRKP